MKLTFNDIVNATNAQVLQCQGTPEELIISTDSRSITKNDVYLPLKGERFDGHDFIESALKNGAKGYITADKSLIFDGAGFVLYVEDTLRAYLQIAQFYKNKINPITIAITGSSGKTTTKERMASVMAEGYKIHKSPLNHNNEIGLCQTMLSMPEDTEVLILEMGMRGLGEIELLSKYSTPDIAVIVNTGTAHIGRLGSVENIAKAKCEIASYLKPDGLLIAHDTQLIRSVNQYKGQTLYVGLESSDLSNIKLEQNSSRFTYKNKDYTINVEGLHNIQNALFVINAALKLGLSEDKIAKGLEKYKPIEKRWELLDIAGYRVINDSYNSNPESLKAAISTFLSTQKSPRCLVLGDMGELGKDEAEYHKEIGEFLNKFEDLKLITVGPLAKYMTHGVKHEAKSFENSDGVAEFIKANVQKGSAILFKASRFMKFEDIIRELGEQ